VEADVAEELAEEDCLLGTARGAAHHVPGLHGQGQGGKGICDQIEPEDLQWEERQRQSGHAGKWEHQHFSNVAAEEVEDELADVVVNDTAFLHRRRDRLEAIILKNDGSGLVDPSASTAGRRRTKARRRARRLSPTASATVATAGRASGTDAA
jgi:hypothetical protein